MVDGLDHRFAIAAKEVNVEDYQRFVGSAVKNAKFGVDRGFLAKYSSAEGPMIAVTWYGAAAYCNWLSEQEGIPKDRWCYLPNNRGEYAEGMKIKADADQFDGYRLPTDAEWEYACRAGTLTPRYYGDAASLLDKYAWTLANSDDHAWPGGSLQPNDLGLFDMLGNAYEWCQQPFDDGPSRKPIDQDGNEIVIGNLRSVRGGAYGDRPAYVHSAQRVTSRTVESELELRFPPRKDLSLSSVPARREARPPCRFPPCLRSGSLGGSSSLPLPAPCLIVSRSSLRRIPRPESSGPCTRGSRAGC